VKNIKEIFALLDLVKSELDTLVFLAHHIFGCVHKQQCLFLEWHAEFLEKNYAATQLFLLRSSWRVTPRGVLIVDRATHGVFLLTAITGPPCNNARAPHCVSPVCGSILKEASANIIGSSFPFALKTIPNSRTECWKARTPIAQSQAFQEGQDITLRTCDAAHSNCGKQPRAPHSTHPASF
jgi:hypothetical protein